jgi:hypothetical protein
MAAGISPYLVTAVATSNVPSTSSSTNGDFTPNTLPLPVIDSVSIANGQYFLLTRQTNNSQNGIWYADANGPIPIMTVATGLNPNVEVTAGPGSSGYSQNGGTTWVYTAVSHDGGPGFVLV